jgi:Reverse transcriptase (RNA-dependent DNA polymerase)
VVQGNRQVPGVDVFETFSPTLAHDSLRTVFAVAALCRLDMRQLDVQAAFLHAEPKE